MKPGSAVGTLAAVVLAVGAWVYLVPEQLGDSGSTPAIATSAPSQPIDRGKVLDATDTCARPAHEPFVPTGIRIEGVTRGSRVLALPRDHRNVPGVPATDDKTSFAWDAPGIKPGAGRGNVLLNAHTWPDGTAMGNRLLRELREGGVIELRNGGRHLCYQVTERLEVPVERPPLRRVYDFSGEPQVVIVVCSGVRRGPGDWSRRTIWFAEPVDAA